MSEQHGRDTRERVGQPTPTDTDELHGPGNRRSPGNGGELSRTPGAIAANAKFIEGTSADDPGSGEHSGRGTSTAVIDGWIGKSIQDGNVEALKALIDMRNAEQDRQREIAYNQAFVRMRNRIPVIHGTEKAGGTTRRGAEFNYGYADLAKDIDPVIQPIMKEEGFAFTFLPIEQTTDYVVMEGRLFHEATGWAIISKKREYIDKEASMNLNQKAGAAQTYAIRYLTVAMLSLRIMGEDTDAKKVRVERGPTKPPPSEKSTSNPWARTQEGMLAGEKWWETARDAFGEAATEEDLEAFIDLIRDQVNKESKAVQNEMGTALQKARLRLSRAKAQPKAFDYPVYDASGETDGEMLTEPSSWAQEFLNYWNSAKGADDRENLLHHNANALASAGNLPSLTDVRRWDKDVPQQEATSETLWDDADQHLLWVEAQREVLPKQSILERQITIREIAAKCKEHEIVPPAWLREMILPIKAAANHREWAEARLAELEFITDKAEFDAAVAAARPRMAKIKTDEPGTWKRVADAFTSKQAAISE